mmetsp:Transcript_23023/g.50199  ORF Transcript_23023/g.50199 Transcript_23023/m.50199 type:complete len:297 (-) Transcript_23023:1212-2102(-)
MGHFHQGLFRISKPGIQFFVVVVVVVGIVAIPTAAAAAAVLGNGQSAEIVARVVKISRFAGFVPQSPRYFLGAQENVPFQQKDVVQQGEREIVVVVAVRRCLAGCWCWCCCHRRRRRRCATVSIVPPQPGIVAAIPAIVVAITTDNARAAAGNGHGTPLPKGITPVDEFVAPSRKPPLVRGLPSGQPPDQRRHVQSVGRASAGCSGACTRWIVVVQGPQQLEGRHGAQCIPTVGFRKGFPAHAPLVGLAGSDKIDHQGPSQNGASFGSLPLLLIGAAAAATAVIAIATTTVRLVDF